MRSEIGSLFVFSDLEGDTPMPQMEQAHPAQDQTIIFVALELSKSAWLLASQSSPGSKISSHRLENGDIVGVLSLLRRL